MLPYLQPIKGIGNLSIAFSKLQTRFSGLIRGSLNYALRDKKEPLIIHFFMQIELSKKSRKGRAVEYSGTSSSYQ